MKKAILILTLAAFASASSAQIIKNNLLEGYKAGDILEKSTYTEPDATAQENIWCGGFTTSPKVKGTVSPVIGTELSYPGYHEAGPSIALGFENGIKGTRSSVYTLTSSGKVYRKGTYYLSFLVNFPTLGNKSPYDMVAINANHVGSSSRGQLFANRTEEGHLSFSIGLGKTKVAVPRTFDFKKTHLIVMKVDYTKNQVALFIDPLLKNEEPAPDAVVDGDSDVFRAGIKAISVCNNHSFRGHAGNFRFVKKWADIIAE
ncbi:hypothetical protein RJT01_14435 [Bacteroides ovatus]|uniref:hypothetical protein n=1 Tax=Bacteroides ovatus TaxID=28116 RepID=UPI0031453306